MEIIIEKIGQGTIYGEIAGEKKQLSFKQGKNNPLRGEDIHSGMVVEIERNSNTGKYEIFKILAKQILNLNSEESKMVGVSTQQNITNVGAALMLSVKEFLFVETERSRMERWSEGSKDLFKFKKIKSQEIYFIEQGKAEDVGYHVRELLEKLKNFGSVIWNMGGGQKVHQMIFQEVFNQRTLQGHNDKICYLNQDIKRLDLYGKENGEFILKESMPLKLNLNLEERVLIADKDIEISEKKMIFSKKNSENIPKIKNYYGIKEFRKFLFKLSAKHSEESHDDNSEGFNVPKMKQILERRGDEVADCIYKNIKEKSKTNGLYLTEKNLMFLENISKNIKNDIQRIYQKENSSVQPMKNITIENGTLKNLLKGNREIFSKYGEHIEQNNLPLSHDILHHLTGHRKHSEYFERVLEEAVVKFLTTSESIILEAYSNVKTQKNKNQIAEYDILFLTEHGTIITLDAKTFDMEIKDLDARLNNLRKIGGDYIDFIPVFPYYPLEIQEGHIPQKLVNLPIELRKRNIKYYTFNDEIKNRKISVVNQEIELNPLPVYFEKLRK